MPELAIYQDIDAATGIGPQAVRDFLSAAAGQPVTIRLNSQGGNVIDGLACYNLLDQYPAEKTVIVDGMALSIASIVAMAGDRRQIAENAWLMIHNPNNEASGDGDQLRDMATLLDGMRDQLAGIYSKKSGKTPDECKTLMAAETWMTGKQAVEAGFFDTLTAPLAAAATFDARRFSHPPKSPAGAEGVSMAASFQDLRKAFPKASAEFIVRCQDKGLELDRARNEYEESLAAALAETQEQLAKAKAQIEEFEKKDQEAAAKAKAEEELKEAACKAKAEEEEKQAAAKAKARGVVPARAGTGKGGQTATARWNDAIAEKVKAGLPKAKAVRQVAIEDPDLQREMIAEANV